MKNLKILLCAFAIMAPALFSLGSGGIPRGTPRSAARNGNAKKNSAATLPASKAETAPASASVEEKNGEVEAQKPTTDAPAVESTVFPRAAANTENPADDSPKSEIAPTTASANEGAVEQSEVRQAENSEQVVPQLPANEELGTPARQHLLGAGSPSGTFRNPFFESAGILRENITVANNTITQRLHNLLNSGEGVTGDVWMSGGYVYHRWPVAKGLGLTADTFLMAVGADYKFHAPACFDQCAIGLSAIYANTSADYKGIESLKGDKNKQNSFAFGPYVGFNAGKFTVSASLLCGTTKYRDTLSIHSGNDLNGPLQKIGKRSFRGNSLHGSVEVSRSFILGNMAIKPLVSLDHDVIRQKKQTIGTLSLPKQREKALRAAVGFRIEKLAPVGKHGLNPYLSVKFARDVHRKSNLSKIVRTSSGS
jgi:hypothetical protein